MQIQKEKNKTQTHCSAAKSVPACTQTHSDTFMSSTRDPPQLFCFIHRHLLSSSLSDCAYIQSCMCSSVTTCFCECCNVLLAQKILSTYFQYLTATEALTTSLSVVLLSPFVVSLFFGNSSHSGFFLLSPSQSLVYLCRRIPEISLPWLFLSVAGTKEKLAQTESFSSSIPPAKEEMRCVLQQRFSSLLLSFHCLPHSLPHSLFQFHKPIENLLCWEEHAILAG